MMNAADRLIVALDGIKPLPAIVLVTHLRQLGISRFKLSASNLMGPNASTLLSALRGTRALLMLDLKVWDTPDSVRRIVTDAVDRLDPTFITVHPSMPVVEAALSVAPSVSAFYSKILPVVYLSSDKDPDTVVPGYDAIGLTGAAVVPAVGVREYHSVFPPATLVCPGVRFRGTDNDNHYVTVEPQTALEWGATHVVVGRPIVGAENPVAEAERFLRALEG